MRPRACSQTWGRSSRWKGADTEVTQNNTRAVWIREMFGVVSRCFTAQPLTTLTSRWPNIAGIILELYQQTMLLCSCPWRQPWTAPNSGTTSLFIPVPGTNGSICARRWNRDLPSFRHCRFSDWPIVSSRRPADGTPAITNQEMEKPTGKSICRDMAPRASRNTHQECHRPAALAPTIQRAFTSSWLWTASSDLHCATLPATGRLCHSFEPSLSLTLIHSK